MPQHPRPADIATLAASALFDGNWYMARYPDVASTGLTAETHYLRLGADLNRDPGPGFCTGAYRAACPGLNGQNPLVHFERTGRAAGIQVDPNTPLPSPFAAPPAPLVDVVMPVFNALEDVQNALQALVQATTTARLHVYVVDDGSDPDTARWLKRACTELGNDRVTFTLLRHGENLGYTRAINTGLRQGSASFVVTLNSDTIVTPYWADRLLACLQSDDKLGIAGPLSNAASWQNIPELWAPEGGFAINPLPAGQTPADIARLLRAAASPPRYPRAPFVNGFCMMIRRAVIKAIGLMDEASFPTGYGEENDFCLRAQQAGFALAYADDSFVFHAKSKSFGTARRKSLSEAGARALAQKHGQDRIDALVADCADNPAMEDLRHRLRQALARNPDTAPPAILFLLPVGAGGGGAHSVIQEAHAMAAMGLPVQVGVDESAQGDFLATYADIPEIETLLAPFRPDTALYLARDFDVVVATLYSSVETLARITTACPWILPAYYAQDYEPFFFAPGSDAWAQARASYTALPQAICFAKTDWIRNQIETRHNRAVAKVSPSLDSTLFHAKDRPSPPDHIRICAMIRPGTARRAAPRTMAFLRALHERHGARIGITIFGCAADDPGLHWCDTDFAFEHAGRLNRGEVAALMRRCDIFLDLSDYQGFGRSALEAMACGATALVPAQGGGAEYARHGQNALVCDTADLAACHAALDPVLTSTETLRRMQAEAVKTAATFSVRNAAQSELDLLQPALRAHRALYPKPDRRPAIPAPHPPLVTALRSQNPRRGPQPAFAGDGQSGPALALPFGPAGDVAPLDVAIHLHLHYPDMLGDFIARLTHVPMPFSLYVSTRPDAVTQIQHALDRALPAATLQVQSFANRGRDIAPFLAGFGPHLRQHDLIGHIHSKASPHNAAKADWRDQLLDTLIGSPASIAAALRLLDRNAHLGLIFPEYHPSLADQITWGTNLPIARSLALRMGLNLDDQTLAPFPAGSMFWARSAALEPLFDLGLSFDDFPPEQGQIDGTPAHGIERLFGEIAIAQGYRILQIRRDMKEAT